MNSINTGNTMKVLIIVTLLATLVGCNQPEISEARLEAYGDGTTFVLRRNMNWRSVT